MFARSLALFALCVSTLLAQQAIAAPAWVDDSIYVPIRATGVTGGRILHRGIKSGTKIELLGYEGDWAKIRFGDIEGYIGKQYVSESPTAELLLATERKKSASQAQQLTTLRQQLAALTTERDTLASRSSQLQSSLARHEEELDDLKTVAADPIRLDRANRELNETLSLLRAELDQLKSENAMLSSDNTASTLLFGGLIIIAGVVIGLVLPKMGSRRRNSGWV